MRTLPIAALLVATASTIAAAPAGSAGEGIGLEGCGARADVVSWLAQNFGEMPLVRGVQGDGRLFELYAGKTGATWTVVVTEPGGESCIVSEGTSLELLPEEGRQPVA
jgi:hypothetical protein